MAESDVTLQVLVEIRDGIQNLKKFESEAEKSTKSVADGFAAIKSAAQLAVAVFAGKQVVDFFAAGIEAAEAQETAMRNLGTALAQTGEYSQSAMKDFEDFANQMEATTKYGDDFVLSQVAIAKSFGVSNEQAKELVTTAADLAAATGDSLDGAVRKLGLTYSGTTGKLDEMVPALKGLTKEQLANGDAVRILAERYQGAAEGEIQTFAGSIIQAKNAFGNLQEAFGAIIVDNPAVIAAIGFVKDIFTDLESIVKDNQETLGEIVTFLAKGFIVTLSTVTDVVGFVIKGLTLMGDVAAAAATGLLEIVKGWGEIFSLIPGLKDLGKNLKDFAEAGQEGVAKTQLAFEKFSEGFDKFGESVDAAAQKAFDASQTHKKAADVANKSAKEQARVAVKNAEQFQKLTEEADKFAKQLAQSTGNEIENTKAKMAEQLDQVDKYLKAGVFSVQKAEELRVSIVSSSMDKIIKLQKEANDKMIEDTKRAAQEQRAAVEQAATNPAGYAVGLSSGLGDANLGLSPGAAQGAAAGLGATNALLGGKAGATAAISSLSAAAADMLIPGIGAAVGPLVTALAQGPEQTKAMVRAFVEAVPDIIEAIADSAPVLVEALVDSLINEGGIVRIAIALGKAMVGVQVWKAIGKQIAGGIIIPTPVWASQLMDSIKSIFNTPEWATKLDTLLHWFTGKEGLPLVFKNFITDLWTPFQNFLDAFESLIPDFGGGGGGGWDVSIPGTDVGVGSDGLHFLTGDSGPSTVGSSTDVLLARVIDLLERPMVVKTQSKFNGRVLADIILELNRKNARLAL